MKKHIVNIAIYMRVSTKKQADSKLGLEAQERNIKEWLRYNYPYGHYETNITYFVDEAMSGAKFQREKLQEMLEAIKKNQFDLCVIYKVDRLARDIEISSYIRKVVVNSKCVLCSTTETFDLTTIEGTFVYNINSVFGEYERAVIKKRTEDSQISRLSKNEYPFRVSFGYRRINKDVFINNDEAEIIQFIFNEYLISHSFEDVKIKLLHQFNLKVSSSFIARVLTRIQYKGCFIKKDILYENVIPAIIDKKLFDKVQVIIQESHKIKKSEYYLYSDLIFCNKCDCRCIKRSVKKKRKRYYYYQCESCNKYINIEKKEFEISSEVCFRVLKNKHIENCTQYTNRIKYLEKRKKEIIYDFALGVLDIPFYQEIIQTINDEIINLKNKIVINDNTLNYKEMTPKQKTLFYQTYISKIYIDFSNKCVDKITYLSK